MFLGDLLKGKKFDLLLLLAIFCLTFRGWFHPGIITHGDWKYYFKETMLDFLSLPYAWQSQVNSAPIPPFHLSNHPIRLLFGLLANFGLDFSISERMLYHFPILFLSMFSMYYLTHTIFKNRIVSFYSTLLFGLNSYVLLLGDHLTIRMAYSLAPLILAFFIKSVDSKKLKDVLITSMLFAVSMAYEVRISYIVLGMAILYLIYKLLFPSRREPRNSFQLLKNFSAFLIMTFLLGAYWIIPFLFSGVIDSSSILPSKPWISWMKISNAIALSHPYYSLTGDIRSFVAQPIHPIFYLIPTLAFLAPLLKKDKNVFFFALLSLIGIFLVKQENPPLGWIYTWMFRYFPGFNMFREASKFYLIVAFGYSVLFGVTVAEVHKKIKNVRVIFAGESRRLSISGKYISLIFLFIILSAQLIMAWPIASGQQKSESYYPIGEMPSEYREIRQFIKNQPSNGFRTLWLPYKSRFSFYSNEYPIIDPEASEFLKSLLIQHPQVTKFQTKNLGAILTLMDLNIKYIVLAPDLPTWEEKLCEYIYHGSGLRGISIDEYKQFLDDQEDLQRVKLGQNIYVYENKKWSPSLFGISASDFSLEDPSSCKVENLILNATFEDKNLEGWSISHIYVQNMSLSNEAYEGAYSIEIELYNSTYGWKTLNSPLLPTKYGDSFRWEFYIKGENSYGVHKKIVEYNENRTIVTTHYMGAIGTGNFSWKKVSLNFTSSSNETAYIQLQVWHGCETTEPLPNRLWVDSVKVYLHRLIDLDAIWLYPTQNSNETLEGISTPKEIPAEIISYQKIDPTKYIVEVNATKPFMLSFGEFYNPLWVAYVNRERIESIPLYSVINGFRINQTGQLEITIEYEPQRWFQIGCTISLTTLIACTAYLTLTHPKTKRILQKLKQKQRKHPFFKNRKVFVNKINRISK